MKRIIAFVVVFLIALLVPFTAYGEVVVEKNKLVITGKAKISEELKNIINNTDDDEPISIAVWLSGVDNEKREYEINKALRKANLFDFVYENSRNIGCVSKNDDNYEEVHNQSEEYVKIKRQIEKALISLYNNNVFDSIINRQGESIELIYICKYAPLLLLKACSESIKSVSELSEVQNIYYYNPSLPADIQEESLSANENDQFESGNSSYETEDYGVWKNNTNIRVLNDAFGLAGRGVKIGLIQNHVPVFNYSSLSSEMQTRLNTLFSYSVSHNLLHFINSGWETLGDIDHANYMLSIITGYISGGYNGIAPFADVYCAGFDATEGIGYFQPMEELVDEGVNVICASIAMGAINYQYDFNARFLDYLISHCGVTICISTGNNATDGVHNGALAYNAISTGNIDDKNTFTLNDDELNYGSNYTSHSDSAYKPDVCAPGAWAGTYSHPITPSSYGGGGTSAAAAIMAGTCALLMEAYPVLMYNPTLLKSSLMSSAKNLPNMTNVYSSISSVEPALLRNYGAGMLNAAKTYSTIDQNNYLTVSNNNPSDIEFEYSIQVKNLHITKSKDVYVSLNWLQLVDQSVYNNYYYNNSFYNVYSGIHHDLYLYDPNGILVAQSKFTFDRKQYIRYKPLVTGNYTVKIIRTIDPNNLPDYYPSFVSSYIIQ